jgi:squalene-hopene/tetraprenyl-beta-curcumene cyclase
MLKRISIKVLSVVVLISGLSFTNQAKEKIDLSLAKEVDQSIKLGLRWLMEQQEENGSWQNYPAITALVLCSYLRAHPSITTDEPVIANGFDFLISCIKPDGGIYIDHMPTYNTAISLTALKDANDPRFHDIIINAEKFLMGMQFREESGSSPDSLNYGGMGYGEKERPDLSNLQWAIEAIAIDDIEEQEPEKEFSPEETDRMQRKRLFYDKALEFLTKCQNLQSVNKQNYSLDDGGFMYEPGSSKAGGNRSYGSMTYAGLKSLIYAKVDQNDIRVKAAFDWISNHFTVETTPLMQDQGLYYYYQTMAKTLNAFGEETITDSLNNSYQWRYALADQLLKTQHAEGFWVNTNGRWWENNMVLVTAYSILALQEIARLPETTTKLKRESMRQGVPGFEH